MNTLAIVWDFDPIFISVGSFGIAYYALTWILAFYLGERVFSRIIRREGLDSEMPYSAAFYMIVATIIGARLGHCLFYDFSEFFLNPFMSDFPYIKVLNIRGGGLASHGAAIGMAVGIVMWSRRWGVPSIWMFDRVGITVALGGAFIRLGNFFNSEIYGGPTDMPWGVIFTQAGETTPHHPTQIYEALAYLLLFAVLMHIYYRTKLSDRRGFMFGVFLIMLFGSRLIIESIKNVQVGWEMDMIGMIGLNMGQLLSVPFIVGGVVFLYWSLRKPAEPYTNMPLESKSRKSKKK